MKFNYSFKYIVNSQEKVSNRLDNEDFTIEQVDNEYGFELKLIPRHPVEFKEFQVDTDFSFDEDSRIFTNGYQSWTVSKEYNVYDKMDEFNPTFLGLEKTKFNPLGIWGAGDLLWNDYPRENGLFYGYSYGYVRNDNKIKLYASLGEDVGFTLLYFDTKSKRLTIKKDLEGKVFDVSCKPLSFVIIEDEYNAAFDKYFQLMKIAPPRVERKCGYTTWYNYYTKVTEQIVENDLSAISQLDKKVDIFQIDDGYERAVGDWLATDLKKFPNGMKRIANKIHDNNMLAGIWLAPFSVTPRSYIFKNHKDWLVKDKKGKHHYSAMNWGGFFALDIYNKEVRLHLKKVFNTILNEWGYDMVKLDFLYCCCQRPIHNKTRGEIMCDAMKFLRELCGDKIILGCGVPLVPAFGNVDFCRIGADVGLTWKNKAYSREDVSTQNTLTNTIYRRHLDGRAWLNDPDVFLLRDNNIKMTLPQRKLIAKVNSLCGNLLFVSDNVKDYSKEQMDAFIDTISSKKKDITVAEIKNNIAVIKTCDEEICFNMLTGDVING